MSNKKLDLSALTKAVHSLGVALTQPKNEFTRDAVIQRYEYTFELAWKMIKRYLSMEAGIDEYNIKNILRIAAQQQLIDNLDEWFKYHKARNLTSHTYNEKTAEETYLVAKEFLPAVQALLAKLEAIINDSNK